MGVPLTLAISEYEHVRDLATGGVKPHGVDLTTVTLPVEEIFPRFLREGEWDAAEMSLGMYAAMRSRGDESLGAIPVFPSRMFRQSAVYAREGGPVRRPEDLAGRRVGLPQWSQTTMVYVRGWLSDDLGIASSDIRWVLAGVDRAGARDPLLGRAPDGVELTVVNDRSLSELLLGGEIDALISSHPPATVGQGGIVRLIEDSATYEADYHARTGMFPIMHLICIRAAVLRRSPEIAVQLLAAFQAAKSRALERLLEVNTSRLPVPWLAESIGRYRDQVFSDTEYWPYGLAGNRGTLETFLRWCEEQGVCARRLEPEDLFPPALHSS
jgi:4,5-dihydroxyphthalate decarboxylase